MLHVVLLTLAWSWQLMFRVCAPARDGLLCALRVLFVSICCTLCLCGGVLPPAGCSESAVFTPKSGFIHARYFYVHTTCDLNAGVTAHVALGSM